MQSDGAYTRRDFINSEKGRVKKKASNYYRGVAPKYFKDAVRWWREGGDSRQMDNKTNKGGYKLHTS
jgi:hypothetical protein